MVVVREDPFLGELAEKKSGEESEIEKRELTLPKWGKNKTLT